jgi:hypothetical protein
LQQFNSSSYLCIVCYWQVSEVKHCMSISALDLYQLNWVFFCFCFGSRFPYEGLQEMCKMLGVLNGVRDPELGMPLTIQEYKVCVTLWILWWTSYYHCYLLYLNIVVFFSCLLQQCSLDISLMLINTFWHFASLNTLIWTQQPLFSSLSFFNQRNLLCCGQTLFLLSFGINLETQVGTFRF